MLTFLLGPATHSFGTDVKIITGNQTFNLKHIVDFLINVLGLKFANISIVGALLITSSILATLNIVLFLPIIFVVLLLR